MHSPRFFPDVSRPDVRPALSAWQKEWDSLRGEIEILRYTSVKHPCGAPIHVMVDKSASLTREATLGGVLFINGQTYGLTVAHAFLPSIQAPEISSESETNDEFCFDDDDDEGNSEMNTRAVLYTAQKEMESFRRTQYKDQRAERSATSSKPTVYPLATSSAFGTLQKGPTTNLGRLCKASTGHGGGLDWAVILIGDEQYRKSNVIRTPEVIIIDEVASDSPKDVKVLAVTPHGHIRGSISGTPYYLKISGSGCFEECWTACLDETICKY